MCQQAAEDPNKYTHHFHKCPKPECGQVWDHTRDRAWSPERIKSEHLCPGCGAEQFAWYRLPDGSPYMG